MSDRQTMQTSVCDHQFQASEHVLPHLLTGPCHVLCCCPKPPEVCVEGLMRLSISASSSGHAHRSADALALDTAYKLGLPK